ncbi:MAG: Hpt domain-containing protein, partial [Lachnospiraceae bacterium]|nr:Hpt domain-containing protein [Lachnospiraceae bacterium]
MLQAFCEQVREYKPQLETYFANDDWEQYAIIAHALKGNALNIGAVEFSGLSKKHEFAGKECNKAFIQKEYAIYVNVLDELVEKIEKM